MKDAREVAFVQTVLPRLLTPKQVAELLGLSTGTLAKMRMTGAGPVFLKRGVSVRYTEIAVREWVQTLPARRSTADAGSLQ
jgi:predicted DNA-binding transcriptional regulator AlpA